MDFGVLGPLLVRRRDATVEIGALKQRALLIHLLLRVGQTVPVDRLIDALWGDDPPPQARVTLRSYVSSLRRVLETADEQVIVTRSKGYAAQVPPEAVDAVRFARLVNVARDTMASDPTGALVTLDEALGLWRGEALADVADSALAIGERTRLEELRLSALEDRFEVLLMLRRHAEAVAGLEAFTAESSVRERGHALLMTALYRSGRAADALAAFKSFREALVDELGLEPSPSLQQLAERILRQDESLELPAGGAATAHAAPVATRDVPAPSELEEPNHLLVGRTHERAELHDAVERLRRGKGGLVLITGEPGIGKSTLLGQFAATASTVGAQVQWGRCQETKGAPAFWPWIQVLREIALHLDDEELRGVARGQAAAVTHLVGGIAERLDTPPPALADDMETARFQLYDAIAAFLLSTSDRQPLVLLLDDLHWADTPSLETLAFLGPLLGSGRVLVAATYRDLRRDWANDLEATLATVLREPSTQQMGLVGLQPDAVAALVERLTGEPVSPAERELLHQRTGGNPFFVAQLAHLLSETEGAGDGGGPAIPKAVTHVIARRLSLVPEDVRALLESACVAGPQFDVRWLASATGADLDAALDAADVAVEYGLIEPIRRSVMSYRFVHALVRETIYDGLGPIRATRFHAQIATALEQTPQPPVAALAEHFWRAADIVLDDRPVRYLLAAADEALKIFAHEQAEAYLRNALQLATDRDEDPAVELQIRTRLLDLLVVTEGWWSKAAEEIAEPARRLARMAGSRTDVLPVWKALFLQYVTRGEMATAHEMVDQLLADADEAENLAAVAAARLAASTLELSVGGDPLVALEHARHAADVAEMLDDEDVGGNVVELRLQSAYMLASALALAGDVAEANKAAHRAIQLAEDSGDTFSAALTLMIAGWLGALMNEVALAAESSDKAVALAEQHGFRHVLLTATVAQAWARARRDGDPHAEAVRMREAVDALSRSGHKSEQARRLLLTAETFLLAGDRAEAANCVDDAHAIAEQTGEELPGAQLGLIALGLDANPVSARRPACPGE